MALASYILSGDQSAAPFPGFAVHEPAMQAAGRDAQTLPRLLLQSRTQ